MENEKSKEIRRNKILDLISKESIGTQEELVLRLNELGFNATQSTVSRDIRKLNITKVELNGSVRYVVSSVGDSLRGGYIRIFKDSVISIDKAVYQIVVRTTPGTAMAIAAAIDSLKLNGIVGCIAGDDTVFCAISDIDIMDDIIMSLKSYCR